MRSGSRNRRPNRLRPAGAPLVVAAAALALALSCRAEPGFDELLEAVDSAAPGEARGRLFDRAADAAGGSGDWLKLQKRAWNDVLVSQRDPDNLALFLRLSERAVAAWPDNEILAVVAANAFLEAGRADKALALFDGALDPAARPTLYAEALVRNAAAGASNRLKRRPAELAAAFEGCGHPGLLFDAAVLSMLSGEREAAIAYGRAAVERGFLPDPEYAWDLGLDDFLARAPVLDDLALLSMQAELALLSGDSDRAAERFGRVIALNPAASWRPYAGLALIASGDGAADETLGRMAAIFPGDHAAVRAAIAVYARRGMIGQAEALVARLDQEAADDATVRLAVEGLRGNQERLAASAQLLAERHQADARAVDFACATLERLGRYGEAVSVRKASARRGLPLPRDYYHEAVAAVIAGDYARAAERLETGGAADGGFAPVYDLGLLYLARGSADKAAERFGIAATWAETAPRRADALIGLGKAERLRGRPDKARAAFTAAIQAYPGAAEAAYLLNE